MMGRSKRTGEEQRTAVAALLNDPYCNFAQELCKYVHVPGENKSGVAFRY
jgi:hypothetical protein